MKVDMSFYLVAQPWTYKTIGGPSKLPKDFPKIFQRFSLITPANLSSYFMSSPLGM